MAEPLQAYADLLYPEARFLGLSKRQKKLLWYGSFGAAGLYFLYKAYKSDTLQALIDLRKRVQDGFDGYGEAFSVSSDLSKRVMADLHAFLNSDEDVPPQSLRQLAKLANSKEMSAPVTKFAEAATRGFLSAVGGSGSESDEERAGSSDVLTRILEALTSEKGSTLVNLAVNMACRSTVQAYCEFGGSSGTSGPGFWQQLLEFGCTPRGEALYTQCVGTFVREGTKVYMGSMEGVSGWEDFLSSLCKPERALAIDRMTRAFVNELVVSYLRRARYGVRQESKQSKSTWGKLASQTALADIASTNSENAAMDNSASSQLKQRRTTANEPQRAPGVAPEWSSALIQMTKHSEFRGLVLSIARTATGEGVRSSILTARELLLGTASPDFTMTGLSKMTSRNLGALLLLAFMPIITFLAGRRSGLA